MRVTSRHEDHRYILVFLNGEDVSHKYKIIDADTIGGYIVILLPPSPRYSADDSRWVPLEIERPAERRTLYGKIELIDRRTGRPYDEIYQAAEAAAMAQGK